MIGKTISHYKILEKLGEGGMGIVYKAKDTNLDRIVAIKFLPTHVSTNDEERTRFKNEAKAAARLNHLNIATIYSIEEVDDELFIVMEYIEGKELKKIIATGDVSPLSEEKAIDYAIQIAEGLHAAHEKGVIHRDIKSANIMITDQDQVKIMDFGLAKLRSGVQVTKVGTTLGTVAYMSPEQARGEEVDHRSDIWSLGILSYEMLTGKLPFDGDYEQAVIYAICNEEPKPFSALQVQISDAFQRIVDKTLAKKPAQRYQHIEEMVMDLKNIANQLKTGKTSEPITQIKASKKKRISILGGLAVVLTLAMLISLFFFPKQSDKIDSIAVLPLDNFSGDPEQEYFSDGMTEALITELSRIKALKVISRTSVMQFKNTQKPLPEIAKQLNVDAVVEGSVLKAGDKVRITAQLIEASSDKHLWAESYERDMQEILSLQKEVAKTIAVQIKTTLTPLEKNRLAEMPAINPLAHEAFLKGHYFYDQTSVESAWRAIEFFDQAIQIEPKFAPAYAGKALAYDLIVSYNAMTPKEGWPLVREWAEKALNFDKNNSDAILSIADVKFIYEWDWAEAEKAYQRSIELNPNNSEAYTWYATFLSSMGRTEEALSLNQKSIELAPLSIGPYYNGIYIYIDAGLFEQADALLTKVKELYPHNPVSLGIEGRICMARGNYEEALELYQSQLTSEMSQGMKDLAQTRIAYILARIGNEKEARKNLELLINKSLDRYISSLRIALVYMALDEIDQAFLWLDRAYAERCDDLPHLIKTSFLFDEIRPDFRFQDLLRKMKLNK